MGRVEHEWQDTDYVLECFGKRVKGARSQYRDFIEKGVTMGKRPDLTSGGLVRSVGGWLNLLEMRKAKVFVKGDEEDLPLALRDCSPAFRRRAGRPPCGRNAAPLFVNSLLIFSKPPHI